MCTNTNCETSLIDKTFLSQEISDYMKRVHKSFEIFKIRKIDDASMFTFDYILFKFRVSNVQANDKSKIDIFTRRVYIMKNLKIKIFINCDILNFERMMINIDKTNVIIDSCKNFKIQFNVTNTSSSIKRMTKVSEVIKISNKSLITISFKFRDKDNLSTRRDFMFHFARIARLENEEDVLFHIIDVFIEMIQIQNTNFEDVFISKNSRLKIVQKYEKEDCYLTDQKYVNLIANVHKSISRN